MMTTQDKSVVAAGHPLVVKAAAQVLDLGGNAFDAAVAAGFAGAVAEPALTSLGGGGFLLARTAKGQETLFDFFVDSPGKGLSQKELEPHFFPVTVHFPGSDQVFNIGLGSVAVPGTLKGLLHVHEKLGSLPLEVVLAPAIELAENGVELNSHQAYFLDLLQPIMLHSKEGQRIFAPKGAYLKKGDLLINKELSTFLKELPGNKGEEFYKGCIARQIAKDMEKGGGLVTLDDLSSYRVIERSPLEFTYRGLRVLTNPPPSFGGPLIALALRILERFPLSQFQWGSQEHLVLLAQSMVEVDRIRKASYRCLEDIPDEQILSALQGIKRLFPRGTTHVSIADAHGNVASMTTSNGEGSGYIVPGIGIMLNNMMGEDDLHPEGFHDTTPGIRVSSMMSPTLLIQDQRVRLVLGSGGSKRIRTAIVQVLINYVDFGLEIQQAVVNPRIHWDGQSLQVEPGFPKDTLSRLKDLFEVNLWPGIDVYFGGVHGVQPGKDGAGDPRRGGCVMTVLKR